MKKVVYLFGAGASKGCLPIINQFPEKILNQIEFLIKEDYKFDDTFFNVSNKISKSEVYKELIEDLNWIYIESTKHTSLDAFAKKLFHRKDYIELDRLKIALSVFLLIEQLRNSPDSRYDTFFASILTKDAWTFPNNVRILSWNYDFQFEFAYMNYVGDKHIDNGSLRTVAKYDQFNTNKSDSFAIYKLNGTTELFDGRRRYHFLNTFNKKLDRAIIEELTRNFTVAKYRNKEVYPALSFAWETVGTGANMVNDVVEDIKNAEILVVIGYSFPDFNREIDRRILEAMKSVEKVYIQAPNAEEVAESLGFVTNEIPSSKIILHTGIHKFLIPREMRL